MSRVLQGCACCDVTCVEISRPKSTSTSTVSMKPQPVEPQMSAVKAKTSANQAGAYKQQGVVQPQQQCCLMQQLSMLA